MNRFSGRRRDVVILECAQKYKEGHDAEIYLDPVVNTGSGLWP
jgi:hypothetical protein